MGYRKIFAIYFTWMAGCVTIFLVDKFIKEYSYAGIVGGILSMIIVLIFFPIIEGR